MVSNSRPIAFGALTLALCMGLAVACHKPAGLTTSLADVPPQNAHIIKVHTPVEWSRRSNACGDAAKRARYAARQLCDVTRVWTSRETCECSRSEKNASFWSCTAEAAYICSDEASSEPVKQRTIVQVIDISA